MQYRHTYWGRDVVKSPDAYSFFEVSVKIYLFIEAGNSHGVF